MNMRLVLGSAALVGGVIVLGQLTVGASTGNQDSAVKAPSADPSNAPAGEFIATGGSPDVYVFEISGLSNWSDSTSRAYSVGTTSCNEGTSPLNWHSNDNQHPVIGQNMYRIKEMPAGSGKMRIEQIGQSWLKHGFCALDLSDCGNCQGTGCISLGVGCSDPYTSGRNGSQNPAGPKWQVNATTGIFPYPPADPSWSGQTARRLRVLNEDVVAASNPDAQYLFEAQYVHYQDSPDDGNTGGDNASYRWVQLNASGSAQNYIGSTVQKFPGITAWATVDPDVVIVRKLVSGEGVFRFGYRVWDNGDGTWDYEYAIHNLDSDASISSFEIPVPDDVTITNMGFRSPAYYNGDGNGNSSFDNTPWPSTRSAGMLKWEAVPVADQNANAIRWGNMHNFRFTADSGPVAATATAGYYKTAGSFTVGLQGPDVTIGETCDGDIDGSNDVGFSDLLDVLSNWGPCVGCPQDVDGDDNVGFSDVLVILSTWGPCP